MAVPLVTQRRGFGTSFFIWLMDVISNACVERGCGFSISVLLSMGRLTPWLFDVPMSVMGNNGESMSTCLSGSCVLAK